MILVIEMDILHSGRIYDPTDDNIINIFSSINIGNAIKTEDLNKIAEILNAEFIGFKIVNQEYRFAFQL